MGLLLKQNDSILCSFNLLIKNAVEANQSYREKHGQGERAISIRWALKSNMALIEIIDCGDGIHNPENLFTPFYTTKTKGMGIGLVLSQQIIEAHDGYLSINNKEDGHGCVVTIELPLFQY